jgi:hypothetical protein
MGVVIKTYEENKVYNYILFLETIIDTTLRWCSRVSPQVLEGQSFVKKRMEESRYFGGTTASKIPFREVIRQPDFRSTMRTPASEGMLLSIPPNE